MCAWIRKSFVYTETHKANKVNHAKEPKDFLLFCIFLFHSTFSVFIGNNDTWKPASFIHLYRLTFFIWMQTDHVNTAIQHCHAWNTEHSAAWKLKSAPVAASTSGLREAAASFHGPVRSIQRHLVARERTYFQINCRISEKGNIVKRPFLFCFVLF